MNFKDWAIQQHKDTNHMYDLYLPYEFHLRMVDSVGKEFFHLLQKDMFLGTYMTPNQNSRLYDITSFVIENACFGHDLIEDVRVTFNNIVEALKNNKIHISNDNAIAIAEIIRAVTNYGRGRDRNERMPDFVYEDIRTTPGATYVKLCDRIANIRYGLLTKSSMTEKYKKEHPHFKTMLYTGEYKVMWDELEKLLNIK